MTTLGEPLSDTKTKSFAEFGRFLNQLRQIVVSMFEREL